MFFRNTHTFAIQIITVHWHFEGNNWHNLLHNLLIDLALIHDGMPFHREQRSTIGALANQSRNNPTHVCREECNYGPIQSPNWRSSENCWRNDRITFSDVCLIRRHSYQNDRFFLSKHDRIIKRRAQTVVEICAKFASINIRL